MESIGKRRVKNNDVIRIPAYNQRVTLEGQVKRPGIFEMKPGESFLIYYRLLLVSMSLPIQHQ
jgi:protein involved in polysaccharide export with SLBB domain